MSRTNWKTKKCPTCDIAICYNATYCRPHVPRNDEWRRKISENTGATRRRLFKEGKLKVKKGKDSAGWKGGKIKNNQGYFFLLIPEHPLAQKSGYVAEHRVVIERSIGRYLTREEEVHHINGIRDDNRLENLKLMDGGEHARFHALNKKRNKLNNRFAK